MQLLQRENIGPAHGLWGMLHLRPLPGSPDFAGSVEQVLDVALSDAEFLTEVGFQGLVVENFGDRPFLPGPVEPVTVAAMARVTAAVRGRWPGLHLIINCLRNDAMGGMAVAAAAGADAIRVNVHCGAMVTDQGILSGQAGQTLRTRRAWSAEKVRIFADIAVKHAAPVTERPMAVEAADLRYRGAADALLLTGEATGSGADPDRVAQIRDGAPDAPVVVASGVDEQSAAAWAGLVDGAIVGSSLMHGGLAGGGVDPDRAVRVFAAWTEARGKLQRKDDI
ncbi:phosphorybosylanthranilate isomerase [bacterium]|nr:MAG: phosphorybosylanthranilate isomerase [bacterium]